MLELENEVYEKIWRLEHPNGIICETPRCNQRKEILPHAFGAKTITQRKVVNGVETVHCYKPPAGRGKNCYWHGQGISVVGHGT